MDSVLNVEVSCFKNYITPSNPVNVNMLTWLTSAQHAVKVEQIRNLESEEKRLELKAALPGITPSGVFSSRSEKCLIRHSGLVQLDIDLKENGHIENYDQLKEEISKIPNVAYCGLSVSGTGFWCLIPIAFPDKHREHILALVEAFDKIYHIKVDPAPSNVASLRGYSYDPDAYFNHRAIPVEFYFEPTPLKFKADLNDGTRESGIVEACLREIEAKKVDITVGYHNWLAIGFSLAATFGEGGREYFHRVSHFHPEYHPGRADRQYSNCLKHGNGKVNFGTFMHHCQQAGINMPESKIVVGAQQSPKPQAAPKQNMPEKQGTSVRVATELEPNRSRELGTGVPAEREVGIGLPPEKREAEMEVVHFFQNAELPLAPIQLDAGVTIQNVHQFVNSQLQVITSGKHQWKYQELCLQRLQHLRSLLLPPLAA